MKSLLVNFPTAFLLPASFASPIPSTMIFFSLMVLVLCLSSVLISNKTNKKNISLLVASICGALSFYISVMGGVIYLSCIFSVLFFNHTISFLNLVGEEAR